MLCDMNSRRATGKTHRASLSTAALGQGVTWESFLWNTKGKTGGQTSARSIFTFAQKVVTVVSGAGSQEPPSHPGRGVSVLPPLPFYPIRAIPDLS